MLNSAEILPVPCMKPAESSQISSGNSARIRPELDDLLSEVDSVDPRAVWEAIQAAELAHNRERWKIALLMLRVDDERLYYAAGHRDMTRYGRAVLGMSAQQVSRYLIAARHYRASNKRARAHLVQLAPWTVYKHIPIAERQHRSKVIAEHKTGKPRRVPEHPFQCESMDQHSAINLLCELKVALQRKALPVKQPAVRAWLEEVRGLITATLEQG